MFEKKKIFIPLFLLTLFVGYQASISMFAHVHYINGGMIVHSHPSNDNQHTHTEGQILTMAQVSEWATVEPDFVTLGEVNLSVFYTLECNRMSCYVQDKYTDCISLRAPPCC